jgi:hypothetical protein
MSFFKSISRCFRDLFSLRRAKAPPSQTITHKAENIPNVEHVTSNRECPSSSKAGTSTQTQPIVTTSSADIDSPTARAVEGLCKPKPRSIDRQPIQNVFVRNTAGLSYIALQIVYDMSDIFPPLRSTIGGLMSLLSLAEVSASGITSTLRRHMIDRSASLSDCICQPRRCFAAGQANTCITCHIGKGHCASFDGWFGCLQWYMRTGCASR